MPVLLTRVEPRSEAYRVNHAAMLEQVRALEEQLALARAGGGEKYVRRHRERKKLLPRERIELLLDRDAPFLELSPLAAWGTEFTIGASVVTGVGVVSGVECVLIANDPTVKGGATNPITLDKNFRAMEIAAQNRLPLINLTEAPRYDPDELLGIGSIDVRKPFEVREVIARVVDGSRLEEFKPTYGTTLVTGWAHLHGYPIGILGNNGILFSDSSEKAAQFIQLCNKIDVPLLFLQNITGYMVGTQYERGGIIKDGAKMINAVSNSTVPMFTVMIGSSYGAGNYRMLGRAT